MSVRERLLRILLGLLEPHSVGATRHLPKDNGAMKAWGREQVSGSLWRCHALDLGLQRFASHHCSAGRPGVPPPAFLAQPKSQVLAREGSGFGTGLGHRGEEGRAEARLRRKGSQAHAGGGGGCWDLAA